MKGEESMKKKMIYGVLIVCLLLTNCMYSACEDIDEVPPRETVVSSEIYKIPDPVILNTNEIAVIDAIKQEYNEHVSQ